MVFKKFGALSSALLLALASLFTFAFMSQAQAIGGTLYWCEFSSNSNWNIATNWNTNSSCSGGTQRIPANGDSLVFNNSALTSTLDLTNNISGLDLNSITFQGTGTGAYDLSGNAISLDSGITDTISNSINDAVSMNVTLTADQTFTNNQAGDNLFFINPIDLGSNNLTLATANSQMTVSSTVSGSGSLTLSSPPSGPSEANYKFQSADPSFTGPVIIDSGAIATDESNTFNALGTGAITVNNGGALDIMSTSSSGTLTNNLNLAGSGISSQGIYAITSCLDDGGGCTGANTTLTLSGSITLNANTVLVNGAFTVGESSPPAQLATFDFTNSGVYNGFSLSGLSNSSTIVDPPTPVATTGGGSSSSSSSVKAPNTGEALVSSHEYFPLIGSLLLIGSLVTASLAFKRSLNKK